MKTANFALRLASLQKRHAGASLISVRNHWNKDWKPAPYPKTQEERERAAKKYGIPVDQYEPYPDDGAGAGDVRLIWTRSLFAQFLTEIIHFYS